MVLPSSVIERATSSTCSSEVWPPETSSARHGCGQRPVLDQVDGDVPGQVVDPVQRLVEREGQGLRGRQPDDQRPHQPRPGGDGDAVDLGEIDVGGLLGPTQGRQQRLQVGPAGDLGHHPAEADVLGDAGRDLVGQQLGAADDPDAGLVAGRLDAQDQRTAHQALSVVAGRRHRRGPGRQVPQPQDQGVPTRPVVVVARGRAARSRAAGTRRWPGRCPSDLEHHRAGPGVPDGRQTGHDQGRADTLPAVPRGDDQPVQIRDVTHRLQRDHPDRDVLRASSVVRPSPSSSPCQLRSLHCSFGAKPASSRPITPGRSSQPGGRDADPGLDGAHRSRPGGPAPTCGDRVRRRRGGAGRAARRRRRRAADRRRPARAGSRARGPGDGREPVGVEDGAGTDGRAAAAARPAAFTAGPSRRVPSAAYRGPVDLLAPGVGGDHELPAGPRWSRTGPRSRRASRCRAAGRRRSRPAPGR